MIGHPARRTGLVTIIVPAKDEESAIGPTLRSLPISTLRAAGYATEVVVLDGHSRDNTSNVALQHGARVIHDREWGKGRAIRNARGELGGDYVVMLDADGTYAPDAIPRLLEPLAWGEADIVMGNRLIQPGSMTGSHRIGNALLSLAARVLYARSCPDLCTGLWGFRAEALHALPLKGFRFELEAEMFALAARLRLRVAHVPVDYMPRLGVPKLATTDALRIAWWLLRARIADVQPLSSRPRSSPLPRLVREPQPSRGD